MSSPRKSPGTPGEASSFRHQSVISASMKPLQLRTGQSPGSTPSSATHTPRQLPGAARRLSVTDGDESPVPHPAHGTAGSAGRLPGRRLSSKSSPRSSSPFVETSTFSAVTPIPTLYNPSIRSSSHPHPIRLRVPKSEEREELSPESDLGAGPGAAAGVSSPTEAWSGKLRVPITARTASVATGPAPMPASADPIDTTPDLPVPGASLIQEALAARGFSPPPPRTRTPNKAVPVAPGVVPVTPHTDWSDSVEVSRLSGNTPAQVDDMDDVEEFEGSLGMSEAAPTPVPHADRTTPSREATESQPRRAGLSRETSLEVSATSGAASPSTSAKKAPHQSSPSASSSLSSVPRSVTGGEAPQEAEALGAEEVDAVVDTTHTPHLQEARPPSTSSPVEVSVAPGKPPLSLSVRSGGSGHSRARPSRSRSGSALLLVSPSRSPEKLVEAEEEAQVEVVTTTAPVDSAPVPATHAAAVVAVRTSEQPSPRLESDRASYVSEELHHTISPLVEGLGDGPVLRPVADRSDRGNSERASSADEHTATPARADARKEASSQRPFSSSASSASSNSSNSSRSPRLVGTRPVVDHRGAEPESPAVSDTSEAMNAVPDKVAESLSPQVVHKSASASSSSSSLPSVAQPEGRAKPEDVGHEEDSDMHSLRSHISDNVDDADSENHHSTGPRAAVSAHQQQAQQELPGEDSVIAAVTAEFRTPHDSVDISTLQPRDITEAGTPPSLLESSPSRVHSVLAPVAQRGTTAAVPSDDEDHHERVVLPAVTATMEELSATTTSESAVEIARDNNNNNNDDANEDDEEDASLTHDHHSDDDIGSADSDAPRAVAPSHAEASVAPADLFDEDEIESVPDFEAALPVREDTSAAHAGAPLTVTVSSPFGNEEDEEEEAVNDEEGEEDGTAAPDAAASRSSSRSEDDDAHHPCVDLIADDDAADDADEVDDADDEVREEEVLPADDAPDRTVISSIVHSDNDDAPTYPSALSEDKAAHVAARTLFATCLSGSTTSSASASEEPIAPRAGVEMEKASEHEAAVEVPQTASEEVAPTPAALNESTEVAKAPRSPQARAKSRFAISSSSSSSSVASDESDQVVTKQAPSAAAVAEPFHDDDEKEDEEEEEEAVVTDAHVHAAQEPPAARLAPRERSTSSPASSSSSGSLFQPHEVKPGDRLTDQAEPLIALAQTTAVVELPEDPDVDEAGGDEKAEEFEEFEEFEEAAEARARSTMSSEAGNSAVAADEPAVRVRAEVSAGSTLSHAASDAQPSSRASQKSEKPEEEDAEAVEEEDEGDEDFVTFRAPAHPFSPAGRRAQMEASAVGDSGLYDAVTVSRLPPESFLFHTAQSTSPEGLRDSRVHDDQDEENEDEEDRGEEPVQSAPRRTPQSISMKSRHQQILQGYLDDVAAMEADQRALLMRDYLDGWRACVEQEAVARGAQPQHVAASKLVLTSSSSASAAAETSDSDSEGKPHSSAKAAAPAPPTAASQPRASVVRRFSHVASSSASSSSSSPSLEEVCQAMDSIHEAATALVHRISEVLADETLYRRYVEEQETTAQSGLSRLERTARFALEHAARVAPATSESSATSAAHEDEVEEAEAEAGTSDVHSIPEEAVRAVDSPRASASATLARHVMHPAVLIAKEPLERDDLCTAELDEWRRLTHMCQLGLASRLRLRDLATAPDATPEPLSPRARAEREELESEESMYREDLRVREIRDRVLLGEYHNQRRSGRSPSSAAGAAARLRASLSAMEGDSDIEEAPEFFEWDPTTNTSAHKTSADDTPHQPSTNSGGSKDPVKSKLSEGGRRLRSDNHASAAAATSTSSPSPRVHSSLLLTSSDPSQEEPAHMYAPSQGGTTKQPHSASHSSSARRSPTVVPSAQTEVAALLRSMHNAQKVTGGTGVRRSHPYRDRAPQAQLTGPAAASTDAAPALAGRAGAISESSVHSTHAAKAQSWQRSLRSPSARASQASAALSAAEEGEADKEKEEKEEKEEDEAAARPLPVSRRRSPRQVAQPPLLSRHSVPCSYCRRGTKQTVEDGKDANTRYHALLRRYGQEACDGSPVRSGSSSGRTPRSPSLRPYADVSVFDSPPTSTEGLQLEEVVLLDARYLSPRSDWSVRAEHGSPRGQRRSALVHKGASVAAALADAESGVESEGGQHMPSFSEAEEDHERFNHVFRVLYPPQVSVHADADAEAISPSEVEAEEAGRVRGDIVPAFVEVIRQGPVVEPSPVPPQPTRVRARSATRRPASAEPQPRGDANDLETLSWYAQQPPQSQSHLPHYTTPTTLSVTRAQDAQLLQAIARARGGADRSQDTATAPSHTTRSQRVRCSKKWSPVRAPEASMSAAARAPVLITRLPLEAGPGVWALDNAGREPYGARTSAVNRRTTRSTSPSAVCVATIDARHVSPTRPRHRSPRVSAEPAHRATPHGIQLHGSVLVNEKVTRAASPSEEAAVPDEQSRMARAFRDWAEKGGVGVVHLPPSARHELPVPLRAALPPPSPSSSPSRAAAPASAVAAGRTSRMLRTRTPPSSQLTATKYSYVDRFFKQSPEQVARTVQSVCEVASPVLHDWDQAAVPSPSSTASSSPTLSAAEALLWPPEASRVYEARLSRADASHGDADGDERTGSDAAAGYVHQYWQQRRAQQETRILEPLVRAAQRPSASAAYWKHASAGTAMPSSSHAYVGRQGLTHAYS